MSAVGSDITLPVAGEPDIVAARQEARRLAAEAGFAGSDLTLIATAVSEVTRNIVVHAGKGEVSMGRITSGGRDGILIVARDSGPGIADLDLALQDGYSTVESLGLGMPGAKRLVDEMDVETEPGVGTVVTLRKWLRS